MTYHHNEKKEVFLYGGIALGLVAGVAMAAYWWRRRADELQELAASPLERAEQLIESCESKLESIEQAIADLKSSR